MTKDTPLVKIENLSVAYPTANRWLQAIDDLSLQIPKGAVLGLVGESGSGKSSVVLALLGLLGPARLTATTLDFDNQDLLTKADTLRGRRIGTVFQDTAASLNPALTIGHHVTEPMRVHLRLPRPEADARAEALLAELGIPRPAQTLRAYPHQLSGGMKQRVVIATALATEPDLLLLDEPTTALDVTIEAQILTLLDDLRHRRGLSMLLVSHNLGIVDRLCDNVAVLYAGRLAEQGPTDQVLRHPAHPYTKGLLAALPRPDRTTSGNPHAARLAPIPGQLPDLAAPDPGCIFRPRCPFAAPGCERPQPLRGDTHQIRCHRAPALADTPWPTPSTHTAAAINETTPLLEARNLTARFDAGGWLDRLRNRATSVLAVDDVSLAIATGEIVGLVGESGCGKSTLGRLLLRLVPSRGGTIHFGATPVGPRPTPAFRRAAQIVFQNPDTALNPRHTIEKILRRPLNWFGLAHGPAATAEINRLLDLVRLPQSYATRYPHQLSGGEKQRVGIARALASRPRFLVCDEAVSALDVSVQAAILNLLRDLRDQLGVAYLFISHDIGVIAHMADRIAVMYRGTLVEEGPAAEILHPPYHPYTELLLASVPLIGKQPTPATNTPRAIAPRPTQPNGCKFADRCPRHLGPLCDTPPPIQQPTPTHRIRCHIPLQTLTALPPWLPPAPPA